MTYGPLIQRQPAINRRSFYYELDSSLKLDVSKPSVILTPDRLMFFVLRISRIYTHEDLRIIL